MRRPRLVDLLLLREPLFLLLEPARVVAFPRNTRTTIELEDPARDVVEEVPVVRDRDHGAVVVLQVPFEPGDRLRVEVVRRLVEQEQIGLAEQEPAQRDPAPFASTQLRHVGVGRRKSQRVHRDLELTVEVPTADVVDLVLQIGLLGEELVEVGVGLAHRVAHLLETVEEVLGARHTFDDVAQHVLVGIEPGLLGQEPDGEARRDPAFTLVAVVFSGDDAQQGRLPRAVQAQHADLRPGVHRDVDAAQDLLVRRVYPAQITHRQDELVSHTPHRTGHPEEETCRKSSTSPIATATSSARSIRAARPMRGFPATTTR